MNVDINLGADTIDVIKHVMEVEANAISSLTSSNMERILEACQMILNCKGRVICAGMGKSGHIALKVSATLASTGTPSHFVHPAEASHGDLGMVQAGDVVLAISNSGETKELADLLNYTARRSIPIIAITKRPDSSLAKHAAIVLLLPDVPEACSIDMAPTTSTTCSLVLGDAISVAVMTARGFAKEDFLAFHPGGKLGSQLLTVGHLMHEGAALPILSPEAPMEDAILEMTSKGFGIAAVVADRQLKAVITDGDLRRNIKQLMSKTLMDVANPNPKIIAPDALASEAVGIMNEMKVTALCVTDDDNHLVGLIHMHDCLRAEVV